MLYEILIRATDLLQELTAISGSFYTVGEDIPETQQDFEGYVTWWGDASWTQARASDVQNHFDVTMPGVLLSPQVDLGNRFTLRTFMMQYADLITQKFIERPTLANSSGQPLNGVMTAGFTGGNIRVSPYPDGQQQIIRYRYSFTLNIKLQRSKVC
jgi:hypothetical protein